jgi:hypothetical protein
VRIFYDLEDILSYWYLAHSDELLLDLDDYMRPTKSGGPWGEIFFRRRLRDAMAANKLNVNFVCLSRSESAHHFHVIIRLAEPMRELERLIWQLHLGSDLYRGRADLMRFAHYGIDVPTLPASLLILQKKFTGLYRGPDAECNCTKKHITAENPTCIVWREYRGDSPWKLFGPSRKLPEKFVPLPLGKVPFNLLMKVEAVTDDAKE